ncbi:hypothetical protein L873DRAFT_1805894 [Choiromyces venosus 120613-1]|uniref:Uncharacterized protein n=1 Tax=Choiromyces venosus 120613-1 TaxID=1336337 RepID=A0A3N4JNR3_9PEZI|nr:hypothetical protein L873DRAFT_1805894 [Choiromyces venosus 120613-1]
MDSHPPSPISQLSLRQLKRSSHPYLKVATEHLLPSESRTFIEHITRTKHFLSYLERYNLVRSMQALANHVFDSSENVHDLSENVDYVGYQVTVWRHKLEMVVRVFEKSAAISRGIVD